MNHVNYDRVQYDLVVASEKTHEFGLRSRTISGSICASLLREFLRTEFPSLNLDEGIVANQNRKGEYTKKNLSPQFDIIVYHGYPWERITDYVLVPIKNVFVTLEVKKWIEPVDLSPKGSANRQVNKQRNWLKKPVFLVGFRHHGDKDTLEGRSTADKTYLFSRGSSDYPDDDDDSVRSMARRTRLCCISTFLEHNLRSAI
jgi:hypothetical protein